MSSAVRSPAGARYAVVGFGAATLDHLCVVARPPAADGKQRVVRYALQPGGQVPTSLVALQRWGLRTAYVGVLAGDDGGERQRRSLREEGVDVEGCALRPLGATRTSFILIDEVSGARSVLWHPPQGLAVDPEELERERFTSARALLLDADDGAAAVTVAGWAKEAGVLVVLDADEPDRHVDALLARTDVAIVPAAYPRRLTALDGLRDALRETRRRGPRLVVATLGGGGALAFDGTGFHYVPAFPVVAVDTTSAGDLFHAGMLHALLGGWDVGRALRFAAAAAALECTALGGRAAIPTLERVNALAGFS
jgi:sugar/nucleoside kinase (ribokinase family)